MSHGHRLQILLLAAVVGLAIVGYVSYETMFKATTPTFAPANGIDIDYYSKVSYCNVDRINNWDCGSSCQYHSGMQEVQAFNNKIWESQGYCGYDSANNRIIAAFRGSSDIKNWIANFEFVPVSYDECSGCQVHDGFQKVLRGISSQINACVSSLAQKYKSAQVIVTGHSLGGAVATLSALEIVKFIDVSRVTFMNFGSPRVGNQAFVDYFMSKIPNGLRVVNYKDPVPHVPPKSMYDFKHVNTEVWMLSTDSANKFKVCAIEEDPKCSDSVIIYNIPDHTDYFGFYTGC